MNMNLAEKLKSLRQQKNIPQEKLAQYLNVSCQAVSKWENGTNCPDISLLPPIARFFGITVDELLQAEILDEEKLFGEYSEKAAKIYRSGNPADTLPLWQEAYHKMPNNIEVKEMLMSCYFDTDRRKYQNEIIELGAEIYNSAASSYYKGQAIEQIARTYAENGNLPAAEQWADRAHQLMHCQEMLYMQIVQNGKELLDNFRFANYWFFNRLFYMSARLNQGKDLPGGLRYIQAVNKTIAALYELIFPGDDMGFEDLLRLCMMHRGIAEDEISLDNDEAVVRHHLTRATECAIKSLSVEAHTLTHPLFYGWEVASAPENNRQIVHQLLSELNWECFDGSRDREWFAGLINRLNGEDTGEA